MGTSVPVGQPGELLRQFVDGLDLRQVTEYPVLGRDARVRKEVVEPDLLRAVARQPDRAGPIVLEAPLRAEHVQPYATGVSDPPEAVDTATAAVGHSAQGDLVAEGVAPAA